MNRSTPFTPPHRFTDGIEGPACDQHGNLYAVNYARQGTIGKVTPAGKCSVFLTLPKGSIGNGIRFNRAGTMFIADYTGHNILQVEMSSRQVFVYAHDNSLNQPNDIAIRRDGVLFASDPNWNHGTGRVWRIGLDGKFVLLADHMGTTNGIEVDPNETILYVNESLQRRVWAFDLSPEGGISNPRLFIEFPDYGLDGMRCDLAGNLYITRFGKGVVAQLSPTGEVVREIPLHGERPTNLAFGGADGRTCYVTIADQGNVESFRVEIPGREWGMWR